MKLVGDAAMFVFPPTAGAAKAAASIVMQCDSSELPPARGGVAAGEVFIRGGDYFAPVVNLASRLVAAASPNTVVVDDRYRRILHEQAVGLVFEALEPRELKGIGTTRFWGTRFVLGSP